MKDGRCFLGDKGAQAFGAATGVQPGSHRCSAGQLQVFSHVMGTL